MSAALQKWMLEQISNFELDKWLSDSNAIEVDPSLKCEASPEFHNSVEDIWMKENDYWMEDIPLFEEIQPLEELKSLSEEANVIEKQNQEKLFENDQNAFNTDVQTHISQPQDFFTSSMENTTLFSTVDNILYIKTDLMGNFAFLPQEKDKTFYLPIKNIETNISKAPNEIGVKTVEEIIRNTAMALDQWESDISRSDISLGSCETSENSPNATLEEESDDPEWRPKVFKSTSKKSKVLKVTRPKNQEDKLKRKKEQNKNAATRYRLKKKAEIDKILKAEEELKHKKAKLTEKLCDIESEIKCLKGLMRDLFKAKGLI